jgi:uncharacterized membrane protein YhaH (DUF805 family)
MTFTQAVSSVLGQYATFSRRAPRSEYWWWVVFSILVNWAAAFLDMLLFGGTYLVNYTDMQAFTPITTLVGLAFIIPGLTVSVRRFHDLDRTGWWLLLGFTGIGLIIVFFWFMFKGTEGPNRYGPDLLS